MASLKRFVENNFNTDNYPCNMYTFERIMGKNGYTHITDERVNSTLVSSYWYNSEADHVIEITISYNARWHPISRDWSREVTQRLLKVSL